MKLIIWILFLNEALDTVFDVHIKPYPLDDSEEKNFDGISNYYLNFIHKPGLG